MTRLARIAAPLVVLFTLSLSLAACQGQPQAAPTSAPAQATKAAAAPAAPGATAAPAAAPAAGDMDPNQQLRVNIDGEPPTLDPDLASWDTSIAVIHLVFEGLLKFDKDLNLVPGIAKEVPTAANGGISADGKTYTFKLREGMKFSDGKPVSAKDVEYSLKRSLDPTLAAEYASFYYTIVGAEDNTSKEKDAAKLQALRDAVGVKAKDDLTLQVTLKEPRASMNQLATMWPMYPVREDIIKANSTAEKPDKWTEDPKNYVGNGPFKVTEWVHQDHITLVPNENYYGAKPKLQKMTLTMVTDAQAEYAAFLNGEREIGKVPNALIEQVLKDPNLNKQLFRSPRLSTFAIQFNHKQKPFDNVNVRRAFATAIDRDALIDQVRKGVGKAAYSWVPPGNPGYQADLGKEYKMDAAKAKKYLADAGFPDGKGLPQITFQYANTRNNPIIAQFAQEQWKTNLGIDVKLEPMEPKAFSEAVNKGQYMMGFYGWNADYPDPDNWLPELFGTGAGNNHTYYSNAKLDELMKKAIVEPDTKKRMDMWAEAQKTVVDEAVIIYLFHDENFVLVKPYVKDLYFTGMDGTAFPGHFAVGQGWLAKH
ncbi:MAG: peptide ABC transporter substrate-binding protein [Chloroflexota bacterium]